MKHPMRYPWHEGPKGTIHGGKCNRTACNTLGAVYFNASTRGYYCGPCAREINMIKPPCCSKVDHDLSMEEMDALTQQLDETIKPQSG